MKISMLSDHVCHLGEGPLWDVQEQALYWVDSLGPVLYRYDYASSRVRSWPLPGVSAGSLALRERGGLILALDRGIYAFDTDSGRLELIVEALSGTQGFRLNDGKVDPFGHFVTGAMNIDFRETRNCAMYRLSPALKLTQILDGFHCFNGPCFSTDGSRLYVTGREEGVIEEFDYGCDLRPLGARDFVRDCNPDGATVDAEGFLWSAQWDDACIIRVAPDGRIDQRIEFAGQVVSSVMFGGPQLDLIYVTTTAAEVCGVAPSAARAGRVLVVSETGYRGRPEPRFLG
jgi:sugar lactone lactonase YvrE